MADPNPNNNDISSQQLANSMASTFEALGPLLANNSANPANQNISALSNNISSFIDDIRQDQGVLSEIINRRASTIEEKYFFVPEMCRRVLVDMSLDNDLTTRNAARKYASGSNIPIINKYYQEVFLAKYDLTQQQLKNGDVTVRHLKTLPLVIAAENDIYCDHDFSDFLNWKKDEIIYQQHNFLTTDAYRRIITNSFGKFDITCILKTLDRFEEFLNVCFPAEKAAEIMSIIKNLPVIKPKSIKEIKNILTIKAENNKISGLVDSLTTMFSQHSNVTDFPEEYWAQFVVEQPEN